MRVVVLTGAGRAFSAGADLEWMRASRDLSEERNRDDAAAMAAAFEAVDRCPKAVVARVHGAAIGGGAGLVACADVAVAVEGARFAFSEVRLGLLPATISPYVLRAIGPGAPASSSPPAARSTPTRRAALGLVHDVVAGRPARRRRRPRSCRALLAAGPEAVAASKRLVREATVVARRCPTCPSGSPRARRAPKGRKGVTAFLEKRAPRWS